MNLLEIIEHVKDNEKSEFWGARQLYEDLTGNYTYMEMEDPVRMTEVPISKWLCTDTWVGSRVIFLDDEPVCISDQRYRKDDINFVFLSQEAADKTKAYLKSLVEEPEEPGASVYSPEELSTDIGKGYSIHYANELLTKNMILKSSDKEVEIVFTSNRFNMTESSVNVKFSDGRIENIPLEELYIPWGK